MKTSKTLLSLAVCTALSTPLAAQADKMTIYGSAGVSVEALDNGTTKTTEVSNNHSAFGIKGSKTLNSNLSAVYLLDMFVGLDAGGGAGDDSLLGGGRDGWAGLSSETWGIVALGFQGRPWKTSTNHLDMFGSTIADYSAIMGSTGDGYFDGGIGNSLIYFGPNINGFSWHLQYGADESDDSTNDWGAQLNYSLGGFYVSLSHDVDGQGNDQEQADADDISASKLAVSYTIADSTTLTGMFETISGDDSNSRNAYYLAASHRISNTTLKLAYAVADELDSASNTGASYYAVGVSHRLDKNIELYALYSAIDNDENATYGYVSAPHTSSNGNTTVVAGEDSNVFALGFRYDFAWDK